MRPPTYYGFRASEPLQGKAPLAANGYSIGKSGNAAMEQLCGSLRARLSASADLVALPRRRTTMPSKECGAAIGGAALGGAALGLAANADSHAEPVKSRWTHY